MTRTRARTSSIDSTWWKMKRWTGERWVRRHWTKWLFVISELCIIWMHVVSQNKMWTTTAHSVIVISPATGQHWLIGSHARAVHLIPTCLVQSNIRITTAVWIFPFRHITWRTCFRQLWQPKMYVVNKHFVQNPQQRSHLSNVHRRQLPV